MVAEMPSQALAARLTLWMSKVAQVDDATLAERAGVDAQQVRAARHGDPQVPVAVWLRLWDVIGVLDEGSGVMLEGGMRELARHSAQGGLAGTGIDQGQLERVQQGDLQVPIGAWLAIWQSRRMLYEVLDKVYSADDLVAALGERALAEGGLGE